MAALPALAASVALSTCAGLTTAALVARVGPAFVRKGLKGVDMLKGYPPNSQHLAIPEAMGVVGASVYVLALSLFVPVPYSVMLARPGAGLDPVAPTDFPHHSLAGYLASLLSLLTATLLGFLDDVFDIRWRYKLPIPVVASVPLLVVYVAGHGLTDVVIPNVLGLRKLLGIEGTGLLALGPLYYVYMLMLSTFCTNAINILAGINGVEVGQSLVIALSIAINDLLYLDVGFGRPRMVSAEQADRHLFSLYFMLPLVGVCFGLLHSNWYPARTFIGDTFCYFSGMAFAVVGILGHFSKTLLLFFIPQAFNFVFSCPQLFGFVPIPRHRMPTFVPATGKLAPSMVRLAELTPAMRPPRRIGLVMLRVLEVIGLMRIERNREGRVVAFSNLTLPNALLVVCGPMTEPALTKSVLACQVAGSVAAFAIRYGVGPALYGPERR